MLSWWIHSSPFNGLSGSPSGPPEWPRSGGMLRQPNRLVEAVRLLRNEYAHVAKPSDDAKRPERAEG